MARRKTTTKTEVTAQPAEVQHKSIVEESKVTTQVIEGSQSISYQGKLQVKTMRGNRVIETKSYHNSGLPSLFRFLCNSLAGSFYLTQKPSKVKLFKINGPTTITRENFSWDNIFSDAAKCTDATPYITYDTTPIVTKVTNTSSESQSYFKVNFHFRIPYMYLTADAIYFAAIYSDSANSNAEACAYYLFDKEDPADATKKIWDPIEISSSSNTDYSIIIDWEMSVKNN